MDIDALHSALVSLTVLPEQIRSARENISPATNGFGSDFGECLNSLERDLRIAKATLARELGFAAKPRPFSRPRRVDRFTRAQKEKLLRLRDALLKSISDADGGGKAVPFVGDLVDLGNDTVERDFALNLLSQGREALSEIDQALKRIESGRYGICEISGKSIPQARLEAIPFARCTVECQAQIEKQSKSHGSRQAAPALFDADFEEEQALAGGL